MRCSAVHGPRLNKMAIAAALFLALPISLGCAQDSESPLDDNPHPYKLQVYTDLVQTPAIVIPRSGPPNQRFNSADFNISLDDGPRFHPLHSRLEGDDPITLSILIDVSGSEPDLLPSLHKNFMQWASQSLNPQDHLSIFAFDCSIAQTANYVPLRPDRLQHELDTAINSPNIHGKKTHGACGGTLHLWDAMSIVLAHITDLPGRRVVLVMSDGFDGGSTTHWEDLRLGAQVRGVAIFAITQPSVQTLQSNRLPNVCHDSGGLLMQAYGNSLFQTLMQFIDTLRHRYILEYHRASNATPGLHSLDITLDRADAIVLPAGTTVPIADPTLKDNPNVIQSGPSDAPLIGNKHPAQPH